MDRAMEAVLESSKPVVSPGFAEGNFVNVKGTHEEPLSRGLGKCVFAVMVSRFS